VKYLTPLLFLLLLFVLNWNPAISQPDRVTGDVDATRSEVIAEHGMVASSQPLATQIGVQILKDGGNAIDAAIAVNAALGVMEPTGGGIGGDLFAIIWNAEEEQLYGLNASGRSPLGMSYDDLQAELDKRNRENIPPYGLLPISVPGAVDGWFEMHDKFGDMSMRNILKPAIDYAKEGFPVSELIAFYWNLSAPRLSPQPGAFEETFTNNGNAPDKGDIFKNPDLADTYKLLAEKGRSAFYEGEIADKIDAFMKEEGGYLRKKDFQKHESEWVEPVSVNYRGYDVYELPPNGQGIAALQMLQMLEEYELGDMGHNTIESLHAMIETKKLAFEDRARFYADPDFADIPVKKLISKEYAEKRMQNIGERAARELSSGASILEDGDTVYLTTADKDGNMVSLIQSNFRGMGSGVVVPGLGFGFQDRGQLFSMDPEHPNAYEPGKRPFHTIIPAFVMKDGEPFLSFGVMGGAMQPQGHVQIITNIIDYGMNIQEAGDAVRWRHTGSTQPTDAFGATLQDGGEVEIESSIDYQVVRDLILKGHDITYGFGGYGGYQAIMYDPDRGIYFGASESRKDGQAAGY